MSQKRPQTHGHEVKSKSIPKIGSKIRQLKVKVAERLQLFQTLRHRKFNIQCLAQHSFHSFRVLLVTRLMSLARESLSLQWLLLRALLMDLNSPLPLQLHSVPMKVILTPRRS